LALLTGPLHAKEYKNMFGNLWQDLRYGVRKLVKKPGVTLIAAMTLALGIGANTAIFSIIHAVLLRPLPFAEQERLIVAWKKDTVAYNPLVEMAFAEFKDWQAQSHSFDRMAVMPTIVLGSGYVLTGRGEAVQVESSRVSGGFFGLLGAQAALGRVFDESDDVPNGPKVAVLSNQLWREHFNADPDVIGQTITLTEQNFTVIGVMPALFDFPKSAELWVPFQVIARPQLLENRGAAFLQVVGKLKAGITLSQAEAELNTIIARIAREHPETKAAGQRVVIKRLPEHLFGNARLGLWLLLAATALLLLIGVANVANLLLAQATVRRREFAVRTALGAGRSQIVRQLLSEGSVLAVFGGVAGVLLAYGFIDLLVWVAPADIPRIETVRLDTIVLLFSLLVTLLTACLAALVPALTASRISLNEILSEGSAKLANVRSGKCVRSGRRRDRGHTDLISRRDVDLAQLPESKPRQFRFRSASCVDHAIEVDRDEIWPSGSAPRILPAADRTVGSAAGCSCGQCRVDASPGWRCRLGNTLWTGRAVSGSSQQKPRCQSRRGLAALLSHLRHPDQSGPRIHGVRHGRCAARRDYQRDDGAPIDCARG
jgi:predicted permease